MCEPTTIGLAIGAVSGIMQQSAVKKQGAAQRKANAAQAEVQRKQQKAAAETKIADRNRQARADRARARVAAAESGAGGQSVALAEQQSQFAQELDAARINKNLTGALAGVDARQRSADAGTAQPTSIDFLTSGISGASSGLQLGQQVKAARGN